MASKRAKTKKAAKKQPLSFKEKLLKAMSHNVRVRILAFMNDRPWSPRELSYALDIGLSQISYHVSVLHDFELIELVHTEPRRGAIEHYYRAVERAFMHSEITKKFPRSGRRAMIVETLEDANEDIAASLASGRFDKRDDYHLSYTPGILDGKGCEDAEKQADEHVEGFLRIARESAKRLSSGESEGEFHPSSLLITVFGSEWAEKEKGSSPKPPKPRKARRREGGKKP